MRLKLCALAVCSLLVSMLPTCCTVVTGLALLVAWLYYGWWRSKIYIPEGYSPESRAILRKYFASCYVTDELAKLLAAVGIETYVRNFRKLFEMKLIRTTDERVKETNHVFEGVHVRVYERIEDHGSNRPALVWIHGGGWVFGSIDGSAATVRRLCKKANAVVFSVGYRLAPENRFPAAIDDCVAATKYCMKNASQFCVDPTRIGIGGDSAGANLAAATCLKLREDEFQPNLRLQVLIYPNLQGLNFQVPSMLQYANGPLVHTRDLAFYTLSYLEGIESYNDRRIDILMSNGHVDSAIKTTATPYVGVPELPEKYLVNYNPKVGATDKNLSSMLQNRVTNQFFSPLMADSLDGLPPAFVMTMEHDPRRDEGLMYVKRLRQANVDVTHCHSELGFHGLLPLAGLIKEADGLVDQLLGYLENLQ